MQTRFFKPREMVRVNCSTASSILSGECQVIRLIDGQWIGQSPEYTYLVRQDGKEFVVPHSTLTEIGAER